MNSENSPRDYGPNFHALSPPEQLAVVRYIDRLAKYFPELASKATAGPGFDGEIYVYVPLPAADDELIPIDKVASRIMHKIVMEMGVSIILMSDTMFTNAA
jgi:hypothetical protein